MTSKAYRSVSMNSTIDNILVNVSGQEAIVFNLPVYKEMKEKRKRDRDRETF